MKTTRKADYPIAPFILNRWSPRAMSGEEISDQELMPLFEAARWAPSSGNNQPWRFLYAKRGSWDPLFNLLVPGNQRWCKDGSALVLLYSKTTFDNGKPARTHSFDTGAAWMALALQGSHQGLVVHGMEGFDYDKAAKLIPSGYTAEAMCVIGKPASKETLPEDLQKREVPSTRKPISELIQH